MMRIETTRVEHQQVLKILSAIRQYDEDWNYFSFFSSLNHKNFQPFASMMRIETINCYPRFVAAKLSAIRQYDEDWNNAL